MDKLKLLDNVYKIVANNNNLLINIWLREIVFSWRWWVQIALTIVPWIIWIRYRDKKYTGKLLFIGLLVAETTNLLDTQGIFFNLWHYDWKIAPSIVAYIPWDFTLFPVYIMFSLQYKPQTNPFIKALIFATFSAFMMEPLFEYLGFYHSINWEYHYSFIIYILLYLFWDFVSKRKFLGDLP